MARAAQEPTPQPDDEMLDKLGVAKLLHVNKATIDRFRKNNPDFPAPYWVTPKLARWFPKDIRHYIATRQQGGVSPDWTRNRAGEKPRNSKRGGR